jgi:hypothetical protein
VLLSSDAIAGNVDDIVVDAIAHSGALAHGASYSENRTVTLPAGLVGTFFLFVRTDALNQVLEGSGEGNNDSALAPIQVTRPFADLIVEAVSAPANAQSGDPVQISWRVRNVGVSPTSVSNWIDRVLLSADDTLDAGDAILGNVARNGALAVNGNYTANAAVTLPNGISGNFHVFVITDVLNVVFEQAFENNNTGRTGRTFTPIAITEKPAPDLLVTVVSIPASAQPGQQVTVNWTVSNQGVGIAAAPWQDRVLFSVDGTVNGATLLATVSHTGNLAASAGYDASANVIMPNVTDGQYRIIVITDAGNTAFEAANEANNSRVSDPLEIVHPDFTVAISFVPATPVSGSTITIQWQVTNSGTGNALGQWTDRVFLSIDNSVGGNDVVLGSVIHIGPLAAGVSYDAQLDVLLPVETQGNRFILVQTDAINQVFEFNAENNNVAAAAITVELAPFADLVVSNVIAPAQVIRTKRRR